MLGRGTAIFMRNCLFFNIIWCIKMNYYIFIKD